MVFHERARVRMRMLILKRKTSDILDEIMTSITFKMYTITKAIDSMWIISFKARCCWRSLFEFRQQKPTVSCDWPMKLSRIMIGLLTCCQTLHYLMRMWLACALFEANHYTHSTRTFLFRVLRKTCFSNESFNRDHTVIEIFSVHHSLNQQHDDTRANTITNKTDVCPNGVPKVSVKNVCISSPRDPCSPH